MSSAVSTSDMSFGSSSLLQTGISTLQKLRDDSSAGLELAPSMVFETALIAMITVFWVLFCSARSKTGGAAQKHKGRGPPTVSKKRVSIQACVDSTADVTFDIPETPEAKQLVDPKWLTPRVKQLNIGGQSQRAVELYSAAVESGFDLMECTLVDRGQLCPPLVMSMLNAGLADDAMQILQQIQACPTGKKSELCLCGIKTCTAKHLFQQALQIYDMFKSQRGAVPNDTSMWSCLLFSAVEAREFDRCYDLFDKIKASGTPSQKDYWNIIRMSCAVGDAASALRAIKCMREQKLDVDSIMYNTVVAASVTSGQVSQAHKLLLEMDESGVTSDAISYNTVMKGYAKHGAMNECIQLYNLMRERGVTPTQVTYGILLDGCIDNNLLDVAGKFFNDMSKDGCTMNTILYTTLIKGLARESKLDEAMRIYRQMCADENATPDVITFSHLLKANCDAGRLEAALQLVEEMTQFGIKPDEVIFNCLLSGCAKQNNTELAKRIYDDMKSCGIKPSTATFSILIRLYSQCKLLDEAISMVQTEPAEINVEVEPRLFSQLIQCCIRARQGRRVLEVYEMMLEQSKPPLALNNMIMSMCVKLNMLDTAVEILQRIAATNGEVDTKDANTVLLGALRKRKTDVAEACASSMTALRIPIEHQMPVST